MKIVTASNGKRTLKLSKKDWLDIGKKSGWMRKKARMEPMEQVIEYVEVPDIRNPGKLRHFSVTFEFYAYNTPPRGMFGRMEDAEPPDYDSDFKITSIEESLEDDRKVDVTETIDPKTKDMLEGKVDDWVQENGYEVYKDSSEAAGERWFGDSEKI